MGRQHARQPGQLPEWSRTERGIVCALVEVECMRALDRLRLQGSFSDEELTRMRTAVFAAGFLSPPPGWIYCSPMISRTILVALAALACARGGVDPDAPLRTWEERDVKWVEAGDLQAWIQAGHADDVVFIDNRSQFVFEQKRIRGARLVPTEAVPDASGTLPLNKWLIMYCT